MLGLRAMVAANAESVMVLYTGEQLAFRPEFKNGKLVNEPAFEVYLREVQQRGMPIQLPNVFEKQILGWTLL